MSAYEIICQFQFRTVLSPDEENIKEHLLQYLRDASVDDLTSFLLFATGSPGLPRFGLGIIHIAFNDTDSIFGSTCHV